MGLFTGANIVRAGLESQRQINKETGVNPPGKHLKTPENKEM